MKDVSSSGSAKPSQLRRGPIPDSYWLIDGVLLAGRYPGAVDEAVAIDRLTKFLDAGIRTFINLTETTEPLATYDGLLRTLSAERGSRRSMFGSPFATGASLTNGADDVYLATIRDEMRQAGRFTCTAGEALAGRERS